MVGDVGARGEGARGGDVGRNVGTGGAQKEAVGQVSVIIVRLHLFCFSLFFCFFCWLGFSAVRSGGAGRRTWFGWRLLTTVPSSLSFRACAWSQPASHEPHAERSGFREGYIAFVLCLRHTFLLLSHFDRCACRPTTTPRWVRKALRSSQSANTPDPWLSLSLAKRPAPFTIPFPYTRCCIPS